MASKSYGLYKYPSTACQSSLFIPVLLSIIYFAACMIFLNNNFRLFLVVPLVLILLILKTLWDQSSHILALIFTLSVLASIIVLFSMSSNLHASFKLQLLYNKHQYENASNHKQFMYKDLIQPVKVLAHFKMRKECIYFITILPKTTITYMYVVE